METLDFTTKNTTNFTCTSLYLVTSGDWPSFMCERSYLGGVQCYHLDKHRLINPRQSLVSKAPNINNKIIIAIGARLFRNGRNQLTVARRPWPAHLRMEEDLGAEEALVADVHVEGLLRDRVDAVVPLDPLAEVGVVLRELLHDVRTHVAEPLLQRRGRDGGQGRFGTRSRRVDVEARNVVRRTSDAGIAFGRHKVETLDAQLINHVVVGRTKAEGRDRTYAALIGPD